MALAPDGLIDHTKAIMARKREIAEFIEQFIENRVYITAAFDGHTCLLPAGERMRRGQRWLCPECEQGWRVAHYWSRNLAQYSPYWKMYGRDIFTVI